MPEKLRYLTSGESHGCALICIIEGIPSGLSIPPQIINKDLARRQKGYGRGGRMKIEADTVKIISGVHWGKTIGSPIALLIENKDWPNWDKAMSPLEEDKNSLPHVTRPRPGHADLSGALKYGHRDIRDVLERSSARETAARVALGAVAKKFLSEFNIKIISHVIEIGGVSSQQSVGARRYLAPLPGRADYLLSLFDKAEVSPVRCADKMAEKKIIAKIDKARAKGDTLGGIFEIIAFGVPPGLGSYIQWDRRLNARLAYALMGIQAIKGVEIGLGFEMAGHFGSEVMDEIFYDRSRFTVHGSLFYRKTNNAGGIEGGISNGMPIVIKAAMKPIPTLKKPLQSVDIISKKPFKAAYERSDVCAVPAASVIGEAVTALVIAECFLEKFGGDSMGEVKRNYEGYLKQIREF
ncbi:MAG: chorismate synthase [Nitrospirae bacterium]|nr:chorismate synthase [Nitrospirota bacterium]